MKNKENKNKIGGVKANTLMIPIVTTVSILHIVIILVILHINISSSNLSEIMRNSGIYTQKATSLIGGSSLLADTSNSFVMMPVTPDGEINVGPLMAYANELSVPRRAEQVMAEFREYNVSDEAMSLMEEAAESADYLLNTQLHAISLVRAVYPIPEIAPLTDIPVVKLSAEEMEMSDEEKLETARLLILSSEYGENKQAVSNKTNSCVEMIQANSASRAAKTGRVLAMHRTIMWVLTMVIIAILITTFITLYSQILKPLGKFVKLIPVNEKLDEESGIHEVRMVASSYNSATKKRDALDDILRSAAEKDALTNLPNRYRFEQYVLESEESGYPVAVLLFDINYLKRTNDTEGHLAGDKLIRSAADCIANCFGDEDKNNCFRFGGDEFAAVVKNCTPESINEMVKNFEELEKKYGISVSLGYAYTDEISKTTIKKLLNEADQKMYDNKKAAHLAA